MGRPDFTALVTVPEAARRTGLGLRQFRRAIASGELPLYQIGAWPRLSWPSVLAWIESTRRPTGHLPEDPRHSPVEGT